MAGLKERVQVGVVTVLKGSDVCERAISQALTDLRASGLEVELVEHHIGYAAIFKKEKEVKVK